MTIAFLQTEQEFQDAVADLAQLRTPVAYDAAGFPDLVLIRPPRVIFAEMKSEKGRVTEPQREWLADLAACSGVESYNWRPSHWFDIELILARDPEQLSLTSNSTAATFTTSDNGR